LGKRVDPLLRLLSKENLILKRRGFSIKKKAQIRIQEMVLANKVNPPVPR